jgi:exosome complex component MTR3
MNKNTAGSSNFPDESWHPLDFVESGVCQEEISKRIQARHPANNEKQEASSLEQKVNSDTNKQNILLKLDCISEASGSSYVEIGNTKILCSVYGPRELARKDDYDFKICNLNCEFRFASFSCFMQRRGTLNQRDQTMDERNYSSIIEDALKSSILLHKYPKSKIDLYILCIQNDINSKNILTACIIGSSLALANASIELYDLVAAYTYIPVSLTVAYMPALHQITTAYFSNETNASSLSIDLYKSHLKESIENCKKIHALMKYVLLKSIAMEKDERVDEKCN